MSGWKEYREEAGTPPGEQLTLLVVDDEPRILESIEELFKERFRVLKAGGGEEALRVFREERPELVLCDQRMPGKTGIEVLKEIKTREPGTIRMLITGYSDIDVVIEALNEEVLHRYVTKPWDNDDLIAVVTEGAHRYLDEGGLGGGDGRILF